MNKQNVLEIMEGLSNDEKIEMFDLFIEEIEFADRAQDIVCPITNCPFDG